MALTGASFTCALGVIVSPVQGAIVYQTSDPMDHFVPESNDDTPDRPYGDQLGNTVTLEGKERYLDRITLYVGASRPDIDPQEIRVDIYANDGREDTGGSGLAQPGKLIVSASIQGVIFNEGIVPVTFDFGSVLVPDSFTFVVDFSLGGNRDALVGTVSCNGKVKIGSGIDALWYGGVKADAWQMDSRWALNDGATSNLFAATIEASGGPLAPVPEPASAGLFGLGLSLLLSQRRVRRDPEP